MKVHRFFGNFNLAGDGVVSSDLELVNQIKNVLRLKPGEQVALCSGEGKEALAELVSAGSGEAAFKILTRTENTAEPTRAVTLYCSILKRENFELVVQKATECGVKKIVPVIAERTVKTGLKIDRLEKIIKEAGEQSGRGVIPVLGDTVSFLEALALTGENAANCLFDRSGELFKNDMADGSLGIFIGPEGGFSQKEIALAKESGCRIASLGPLTLRGETAAIIASYLAVYA
ncbi:MAG: RsmE family RNA methyltransferase [Patescibacteria group bacterium]|nr:RsmE family RNA methyltransferase [Patescibacteria group bacterium]